jgi:transposase InsO family protein
VLTDHVNLNTFFKNKELNRKEARWWERLSGLDLHIEYRPGKQNPADGPSRRPDYESNEPITVGAVADNVNKLIVGRVHVHAFNAGRGPLMDRDGESPSALSPMEEDRQSPSGSEAADRMDTGNGPIRDENFGSTASHAYANLAVRTRALPARGLVSAVQTRASHARSGSRPPETREQHEKSKKTFRLVAEETENTVSKEAIKEIALKDTNFTEPPIELRTVLKILQESDQLAQERMAQAAQTATVDARSDDGPEVGKWKMENGILHFEGRYYIPSGLLRRELLKQNHDDPHAGHFGYEKTLELLRRKYWWPNMPGDVREYVTSCTKCSLAKPTRHKPYGLLQSLPVPQGPRKDWTMDFITDLPPSKRRGQVYDAILVVVDRYTKYSRYIPARKDWTAEHLADELFDEVFSKQGMPESIVSDRGSLFTSNFWSNFCYHLRIKVRLSTAFHPQTDGQTERQNQTLEQYLRIYANYQQDNWARLLSVAEYAYNNSWHSVIKMSPFTALYRDGDTPRWEDQIQEDPEKDVPAARARAEEATKLRDQLYKRLEEARSNQAKYYDEKHTPRTFNVGDKVLLNSRNIHTSRPSKKLDHKYYGPFEVEEPIGKQAYKLRLPHTFRIHNVFHVSLLEPYKGRSDDVVAPPPIMIDGERHDEVELILDSRLYRKRLQYLVKWLGWPDTENQWVYAEDVQADELVKDFHQQYPNKPSTDAPDAKRRRTGKN